MHHGPVSNHTTARNSSHSAVDEFVWSELADAVLAARAGSADQHRQHLFALDDGGTKRARLAMYLFYVVQASVVRALGRRPTASDLDDLAAAVYMDLNRVAPIQMPATVDVLRTYFGLPTTGLEMEPGALVIYGSVVAAALTPNGRDDLDEIRDGLTEWLANVDQAAFKVQ